MNFIRHPRTNAPDPMLTLVYVVVVLSALKFLFEGVSFTLGGLSFNLGHADAATYAALLTPVLGAHGYIDVRSNKTDGDGKQDGA